MVEPPILSHRLGNYAQIYESLKTMVQMNLACSMLSDSDNDERAERQDDLYEQLGEAEMEFWEAIRAFHQTNGDDPNNPVSINGILYLAMHAYEHQVIYIEPTGIVDIIHKETLKYQP